MGQGVVAGGEEGEEEQEEEKERAKPFILATEGSGQTTCAVPSRVANILLDSNWTTLCLLNLGYLHSSI